MKLRVKGWLSFQHYKDRNPPWIKLHKSLLDDFEYQSLPVASRALAPMIWLLASEDQEGIIDCTIQKLAFRLRQTEKEIADAIKPLIDAGFVIDDNVVLASCNNDAMPETETEIERETETETDSLPKQSSDRVPYEQIKNLYHEKLPTLPKCLELNSKRKAQIKARWKSGQLPDLETWERYFEFISKSDFLMGKCEPAPGRKHFVANLEWITKETNYTNIYERKYHG